MNELVKRFFIVLASVILVVIAGFLTLRFMYIYEPTPNKGDVEEMVKARDLEEFGKVEGSFLYTPKNYSFYNDTSIYIVEQNLDKGQNYEDQFVVIEKGVALTDEDCPAISQIEAREGFNDGYTEELQVLSKHQMTVYRDSEEIESAWLYKITFHSNDEYYLTFLLPEEKGEDRFNFFTEGYEQFRGF